MDLFHLTGPRDNDTTRSENAHRDSFALALAVSCTLTLTEVLAFAYACFYISCVVEEFGVNALINGLFQHTKEIVLVNQDLM